MDGTLTLALVLVIASFGLRIVQQRISPKETRPNPRDAVRHASPERFRLFLGFLAIFFVGTLVISYFMAQDSDRPLFTALAYVPPALVLLWRAALSGGGARVSNEASTK